MYNANKPLEWQMYSFFILGQVPGTSITITFTMWAQLALLIAGAAVLRAVRRRQQFTPMLAPTISAD